METLPRIDVLGTQRAYSHYPIDSSQQSALNINHIDLANAESNLDRPEDAFQLVGIGSVSTNSGGLGTGINLRGFDIGGRIFAESLPDIQRMYVRDLATVERIDIVNGPSSVIFGTAAPGGMINYLLRKPTGLRRTAVQTSIDNHGLARLVLDHDQPLGKNSALRLIYAGQSGGTFIQNVDNRRQSLLLSAVHGYNSGTIEATFEYQRNERPYGFGTVYADNRFWFDRYYVAPAARSMRKYQREGLHWNHELSSGWSLVAGIDFAQVRRNETLAGFWTIESDTTLSSYYRKLTDDYNQSNFRIELRGNQTFAGMKNETTFGYQRDRQRFDFSGPQNIGGYSIDIANPDFNLNWAALPLSPRVSREHDDESGIFWFDQLHITNALRLLAGLRESSVQIETGNATTTSTATDIHHLTSISGVAWNPLPWVTLHLTRSESFEPNLGLTRTGGYLQPRDGRQWETGVAVAGGKWNAKLAVFDLEQSNLTATDPLDHDARITIGTIRVQGIESAAKWNSGAVSVNASLGVQRAWNGMKTSASLGDKIVNVPNVYGSLGLDWKATHKCVLWSALAGVGERAGDPQNTFTAPGYATLNAGIRYRSDSRTSVALSLDNIADKRYVEALTAADNVYQGDRRRIIATFRHQFQ